MSLRVGGSMSRYEINLEIAGPTAMWTRPDSGDCPVSYPAPTYSATKGIFEAILFNQAVEVVPLKVEICAPIAYHTYNTFPRLRAPAPLGATPRRCSRLPGDG